MSFHLEAKNMLSLLWRAFSLGTMAGELLRVSVNQVEIESAQASLKRGEAGCVTQTAELWKKA